MKISDLFIKNTEAACGCINGALTLKENIDSKLQDIANFVNSLNDDIISVSIPDSVNPVLNRICALSRDTFNACLNGDISNVQLYYGSDEEDFITLSSEEVINNFNDNITNLKVQKEFLDYCCISGDTIDASNFLTRINSSIGNIAPKAYEIYSKCIDLASTPIEALKNFFAATTLTTVRKDENNYITLTDLTDYGGAAWVVAINNVFSTIESFFANCWQGISKIAKFFDNVVKAIGKVGKWLFQKAFSNLFTVYVKQGKNNIGYMDLPIIQVTFTETELSQFDADVPLLYPEGYAYPWNHYAYRSDTSIISISDAIHHLARETIDGNIYNSTVDVIYPSSPYNLLIRIGMSDADHYVVLVYACFTVESTHSLTDEEIEELIWTSVYDMVENMGNVAPFIYYRQNVDDTSIKFSELTKTVLELTHKNLALDLRNHMVGKTYTDFQLPNNFDPTTQEHIAYSNYILYGLIQYAAIMSKNIISNIDMSDYCIPDDGFDPEDPEYYLLNEIDAFDDLQWNVNAYRPYFKRSLIPCSVHYQTTAEEAREIEYVIIGALITTAIAITAVLTISTIRKFKVVAELAQANVDRLSWETAENPTKENMSDYLKARKKNNRIKRIQRLLGFLPKNDDINSDDINLLASGLSPNAAVADDVYSIRKLIVQ